MARRHKCGRGSSVSVSLLFFVTPIRYVCTVLVERCYFAITFLIDVLPLGKHLVNGVRHDRAENISIELNSNKTI